MSGLDLCRVLRQDPAAFAVPIVFLTGDVAETIRVAPFAPARRSCWGNRAFLMCS